MDILIIGILHRLLAVVEGVDALVVAATSIGDVRIEHSDERLDSSGLVGHGRELAVRDVLQMESEAKIEIVHLAAELEGEASVLAALSRAGVIGRDEGVVRHLEGGDVAHHTQDVDGILVELVLAVHDEAGEHGGELLVGQTHDAEGIGLEELGLHHVAAGQEVGVLLSELHRLEVVVDALEDFVKKVLC